MDGLSIMHDVLLTACAIAGTFIAAAGLRTWQKQLKGTHERDIAFRFHHCSLKIREAVAIVRAPMVSSAEVAHALQKEDGPLPGDPLERIDLGTAAVHDRRWKYVTDALADFDAVALEAEVLWPDDVEPLARALRDCVRRLAVAISSINAGKSEAMSPLPLWTGELSKRLSTTFKTKTDPPATGTR